MTTNVIVAQVDQSKNATGTLADAMRKAAGIPNPKETK